MKKTNCIFFSILSLSPSLVLLSCGANEQFKITSSNYYLKAGNLKEDDKWWNLNDINYTESVTKGIGTKFYSDLNKNNNSYKVLSLRDWYNTYDTDLANVFNDENHKYNNGAPKSYSSGTKNYKDIYYNDSSTLRTKTGNNNNGFNGIYSGTKFWIENDYGNHWVKKYDVNTIESFNGKEVALKNSHKVSNGWEHVSPWSKEAEAFGYKGKRKNTTGIQLLDWSTGDLHNLRPSIQDQFNSPRSNNLYGMVPGNNHKYQGIDFEIGYSNFGLKVTEPRISVRGDLARITFYMHDRYHLNYDYDYYRLLLLWAKMDPVTKEEKYLDQKIKKVMGFSNDYVTGVKQLPYDEEIEKKVIEANKDETPNANNPGVAKRLI